MLELNSQLLKLCIFPKTLCFVKNVQILEFILYPFNFKGELKFHSLNVNFAKKSYLRKCVIRAGFKWASPFREEVAVKNSLAFFNSMLTKGAFFSFFSIDPYNITRPWEEVDEDIKTLLLLSPLFLKQGEIWCIFIEDNILSKERIKKLDILFSSKLSNSNGIILYTTASGNRLFFEMETWPIL